MDEISTRNQILEIIRNQPGIYFRELQREAKKLGLKGAAQYHILVLTNENRIYKVKYSNYNHFFDITFHEDKVWIPIFNQYEVPQLIMEALKGDHLMSAKMVSELITVPINKFFYYAKKMVDKKILTVEVKRRTNFYKLIQSE